VRPLAVAASVLVHSMLAAVLLVRCSTASLAEPPPSPRESKPEGPSEVQVRLLPSYPDGFDDMPCESHYRGIGILSMDGTISSVSPGGPADRAGLKAHDFILNFSDLGQDRYMVGYRLTLRIRREGRVIEVPVVISRICYE
jgi:hypothetical protein